jgi:opacity protein-like surface antigen
MKKILAVVLMMLCAASLAVAAEDVFTKLDKNKDGRISEKEYLDQVSQRFANLDKNHDGALAPEELEQIDKNKREQLIKVSDTDNDGVITKEELDQAARKKFSTLDGNADGYIDKKEKRAAFSDRNKAGFVLFTF